MSAPSFHALYAAERKATAFDHPKWRHNDKDAARALAARYGIPVAPVIEGPAELSELTPPTEPAVLKPIHGCGGRGVFPLEPRARGYRDILRAKTLTWAEVLERAEAAVGTSGLSPNHPDYVRGPWIVEQLIPGPKRGALPYNWDCYCIGGKVQVIRQREAANGTVLSRGCWRAPDGSLIGDISAAIGGRRNYDATMPAPKDPATIVEAAERIARDFPAPFVRVDFYETPDGIAFSEITPHPGGAKLRFTPEWDERLGAAWPQRGR